MSYYSEKDESIYYDLKLSVTTESKWDLVWKELKQLGYIWQDVNGKRYKENELNISYLKNILKHCNYSYRPSEQIDALKELLNKKLNKIQKSA